MPHKTIKGTLIALMALWVLAFTFDSIMGINWPSTNIHRAFIWFPSVVIGLYWLMYGGKKKTDKT